MASSNGYDHGPIVFARQATQSSKQDCAFQWFAARLRDLRACVTDRDESHRYADGGRRSMGFGAAVRFVSVHDDMRRRRRMRAAVIRRRAHARADAIDAVIARPIRGVAVNTTGNAAFARCLRAECCSAPPCRPSRLPIPPKGKASNSSRRTTAHAIRGQEQHGHRSSDGEHQLATTFVTCGRRRRAC